MAATLPQGSVGGPGGANRPVDGVGRPQPDAGLPRACPGRLQDAAMNFEDLPKDWHTVPLTDPDRIADVLDLLVPVRDRYRGALLIAICDAQRRFVQAMLITELGSQEVYEGTFFEQLADLLADAVPGCTVLCALARRRNLQATERDQQWRRVLESSFAGRVELIGMHLVTVTGCLEISAPAAA
jgi:hypothetical protein